MYYNDQLWHWGIKGQKWGVRRYQNPDGTLTEAGKARYSDERTSERNQKTRKKGLSDKQKKILKVGAAAAVTALAAYGGYRLYKSGRFDSFIDAGKQKATNAINGAVEKSKNLNDHPDYTRAHEKKSIRELSDAELNAKINRLQKEKQYESMIATPSRMKKAIAVASSTAAALGTINTLYNNYNSVTKIGKNILESDKFKNAMASTAISAVMKVHGP